MKFSEYVERHVQIMFADENEDPESAAMEHLRAVCAGYYSSDLPGLIEAFRQAIEADDAWKIGDIAEVFVSLASEVESENYLAADMGRPDDLSAEAA
jgi:hypothetical protein